MRAKGNREIPAQKKKVCEVGGLTRKAPRVHNPQYTGPTGFRVFSELKMFIHHRWYSFRNMLHTATPPASVNHMLFAQMASAVEDVFTDSAATWLVFFVVLSSEDWLSLFFLRTWMMFELGGTGLNICGITHNVWRYLGSTMHRFPLHLVENIETRQQSIKHAETWVVSKMLLDRPQFRRKQWRGLALSSQEQHEAVAMNERFNF